ncbi:MAG: hypothetical protein O3B31_08925 [Chloroflexi bacterium]|nr:hypothetical protein [Chloroflexota bacterium]
MATAHAPEPWYRALIRRRAQALLVTVSTTGAMLGLALVIFLRLSGWSEVIGLVLIFVLSALLERNGSQLFSQTRASVSAAAIMGAGILYGIPAVVPIAITVAVAAWIFRGKPITRLTYNGAVLVFAGVGAAAMYRLVTGSVPDSAATQIAAAVAAGFTMWFVNMALVGAMISFTSGESLWSVVRNNYLWLSLHFAVMGLVGLGLALSWRELGVLGFVAFTAPVGVLAMALRQGASTSHGTMLDAVAANALIQDYERLLAEVESSSEDLAEFIAARRPGALKPSADDTAAPPLAEGVAT